MTQLHEQIDQLSSEELIEATNFVLVNLGDDIPEFDTNIVQPYLDHPLEQLNEISNVCKIILLNAGAHPEFKELVSDAIANTGKKNFVLSGEQITTIILSLGVLAYLWPAKSEEVKITYDKKGRKVTHKVKYQPVGSFINRLITTIVRLSSDKEEQNENES